MSAYDLCVRRRVGDIILSPDTALHRGYTPAAELPEKPAFPDLAPAVQPAGASRLATVVSRVFQLCDAYRPIPKAAS